MATQKSLCSFALNVNGLNSYLTLVVGWLVYFALHSLGASQRIKSRFRPLPYRLLYVVLSTLGLLAMLLYNGSIPAGRFFESHELVRYLSLLSTTVGVMVIQSAFRQYSFKGFIGLKNESSVLRIEGVLKYVRHPIYAGIILIVMGFFLFIPNLPTLVSCVCILTYLPIGIYLEEKKLVAAYGDAYIDYRSKVSALLPTSLFVK